MNYVWIDTNAFVHAWSQGKPGYEMQHVAALKSSSIAKSSRILLPEVEELELDKNWGSFFNDLGNSVADIERALGQLFAKPGTIWSEAADFREALAAFVADWKSRKRTDSEARHKEIRALLASPHVDRIPLTTELLLQAMRRRISGRMPRSDRSNDQDALLIESLRSYFAEHEAKQSTLYICSENTKDFAVELKGGKGWVLHPALSADLPKSAFYTSLSELLDALKAHRPVKAPSKRDLDAAVAAQKEKEQSDTIQVIRDLLASVNAQGTVANSLTSLTPSIPLSTVLSGYQPPTSTLASALAGYKPASTQLSTLLAGYQPTTSPLLSAITGYQPASISLSTILSAYQPPGSALSSALAEYQATTAHLSDLLAGYQDKQVAPSLPNTLGTTLADKHPGSSTVEADVKDSAVDQSAEESVDPAK